MANSNNPLLYESSILLNTHYKIIKTLEKLWNIFKMGIVFFLMKAEGRARAARVESSIHLFSHTDKSGRGRTYAHWITGTGPDRDPRERRCDIWSYFKGHLRYEWDLSWVNYENERHELARTGLIARRAESNSPQWN